MTFRYVVLGWATLLLLVACMMQPSPKAETETAKPSAGAGRSENAASTGGSAGFSACTDVARVVEGSNRFAVQLYRRLRQQKGNLCFSPGSISMTLAMTHAGARGETEEEMAEVLHFRLPQPALHEAMACLLSLWEKSGPEQGCRLSVANRLWGQEGHRFQSMFLRTIRRHYGAEPVLLDFASESEASRRTINRWVKHRTAGRIAELIPPGALPSDSKLVLTNAVYFDGKWSRPFLPELTEEAAFHLSTDATVRTALMNQKNSYGYLATDALQVLEMPYGDRSFSLLLILPKKNDGLDELEDRLTYDRLECWTSALQQREVDVFLPKFKATGRFSLNGALSDMGMASAFSPETANFSKMTGERDLFVSKVIHQAFIQVDEQGTEAAAATGVTMVPVSLPAEESIAVFRADHPFLYMIRDNRNGAILFIGRLLDPEQ